MYSIKGLIGIYPRVLQRPVGIIDLSQNTRLSPRTGCDVDHPLERRRFLEQPFYDFRAISTNEGFTQTPSPLDHAHATCPGRTRLRIAKVPTLGRFPGINGDVPLCGQSADKS